MLAICFFGPTWYRLSVLLSLSTWSAVSGSAVSVYATAAVADPGSPGETGGRDAS